jgi:hypothetical protein
MGEYNGKRGTWKEFAKCKRCNKKFEVKHKLRKLCDDCKKRMGKR